MKRFLVAAAALLLAGGQARADGFFSDTSVGIRYGINFKEPGVASASQPHGEDIHKEILNIANFDTWKYGSNFFNLDALFSDGRDPASNSTSQGAVEVYGVYRGQLSPDALFGINTNFGPFKAINFEAGVDFNTKNTTFAPEKKLLLLGPNLHFDVPVGFLDVGLHLHKEWNYNGISFPGKTPGAVSFDPTFQLEVTWLFPLLFTNLPLTFQGFIDVNLPKGKDGFGAQTVTEVLARPQITLDVGKLVFNKPHVPDVYFAFEYWLNKFGGDHTKVPGSLAYTPMIGMEVHF